MKEVGDIGVGLLGGLVVCRVGVSGGNACLEEGAGEFRYFNVLGVDIIF